MVVQETQSVAIMEQILCLDKTWPFQRLEVVLESLGLPEGSNIRIQLQLELALMQGLAITSSLQ